MSSLYCDVISTNRFTSFMSLSFKVSFMLFYLLILYFHGGGQCPAFADCVIVPRFVVLPVLGEL